MYVTLSKLLFFKIRKGEHLKDDVNELKKIKPILGKIFSKNE